MVLHGVIITPLMEGWIDAMFFANSGDVGDELTSDHDYSDLSADFIQWVSDKCSLFTEAAGDLLEQAGDDSQNGHDLYLTQCGHGVGFWDRGYGDVGEKLSEIAHAIGEVWVYVGDDGKIYLSQ